MFNTLQPHGLQHARLPCPSLSPRVCSDSRPLSWWCHPTISSSVTPFTSFPQYFPASGSFPMSLLFTLSGQSIGVSASASVLPMNIQDWFTLGWTGWISLQSKRFSRVFSSTTVWKHQFLGAQLCLWSNSHICTGLLEIPNAIALTIWTFYRLYLKYFLHEAGNSLILHGWIIDVVFTEEFSCWIDLRVCSESLVQVNNIHPSIHVDCLVPNL